MAIRVSDMAIEEVVYVAALSLEDARVRAGDSRCYGTVVKDTPQDAWDALSYWDKCERHDEFDVFEIATTIRVKKIEPPYTER